jgi:hypothetical protein
VLCPEVVRTGNVDLSQSDISQGHVDDGYSLYRMVVYEAKFRAAEVKPGTSGGAERHGRPGG